MYNLICVLERSSYRSCGGCTGEGRREAGQSVNSYAIFQERTMKTNKQTIQMKALDVDGMDFCKEELQDLTMNQTWKKQGGRKNLDDCASHLSTCPNRFFPPKHFCFSQTVF